MSFITESEIMGGTFGDDYSYSPIENEPMGRDYSASSTPSDYDYFPLSSYFADTQREYSNHITNHQGFPDSWSVEDDVVEQQSGVPGFRDDYRERQRDGRTGGTGISCATCARSEHFAASACDCSSQLVHAMSMMMIFVFIIMLVVVIAISHAVSMKKIVKIAKHRRD
jgi:hypothetical protein